MIRIRNVLLALWLAVAVLAGQQAVALHDLAHAASHKEGVPGKSTCDKCFACAELSSAVGASIPPAAPTDTAPRSFHPYRDTAISPIPCVAYNSRAPPTFL